MGLFGVSYVPYSTRRWTPRATFQQTLVRFTRQSGADYDSQNLSFISSLDLGADQFWGWNSGIALSRDFGRLGGGGEFYKYFSIDNSITCRRPLDTRRRLYFLGAYWLGWRNTDPIQFSRIENALTLAIAYSPVAQFSIVPYVRPAVFIYTHDSSLSKDRRDLNLNAGLAVNWIPLRAIALSAGFNWTGDYSTSTAYGYQEFQPGVSLSARFGF